MKVWMKQEDAKTRFIGYIILAILCIGTAIYLALQYMTFGAVILFTNSWNGTVVWSTGWLLPFEGIFGFALVSITLFYKAIRMRKQYFLK